MFYTYTLNDILSYVVLFIFSLPLPLLWSKTIGGNRPEYIETTEECLLLSSEDKQFLLYIIRNQSSKDLKDRARILFQINEGNLK